MINVFLTANKASSRQQRDRGARPTAESASAATAAAAAAPSLLSSVRDFIDNAQLPSWLGAFPSRVVMPETMRSRCASAESDAEDRRRQFLASDCRNSDSDTGLTKTAVLLSDEEYPVGYLDVAPERQVAVQIETKEEPVGAASHRVTVAEGVEVCLAVPAEEQAWWEQRAAASSERHQMRATL